MAALTAWMMTDYLRSADALDRIHARAYIERDIAYRRWNATKGGVYAPVSERTPPNPYLEVPNRDVTTDQGQRLTLINPSYMTRQVHELVAAGSDVIGHLTSLDPLRPENAADAWEREALLAFEQGVEEVSGVTQIGEQRYLRLMRPLVTEAACLKCHAEQGYRLGDIRGGISISIPYASFAATRQRQILNLAVANLGIWLVGLTGIILGTRALVEGVVRRDQAEASIRESEARLKGIFTAAPFGLGLIRHREIKSANRRMSEITGYRLNQLLDRNTRFLYPSEADYQRVGREKYAQIRAQGLGVIETRFRRQDGQIIDVRISSSPLDRQDISKGIAFSVEDITERKRAEDQLREAAAVFANTTEGVTVTDLEGRIRDVNQAFCTITGYQRDEVIGQNPRILQSGRHDSAFYAALWNSLLRTGQWRGEIWNRRKDGAIYPEWLNISLVKDEQDVATGYVAVFSDITQIKASEERLHHLAHHDSLTGLPNRLLLEGLLERAIQSALRNRCRLALAFVDLDRFKQVNDQLGHRAGDTVLREASRRLRAALRASDSVARVSGDEFVVLLEELSLSDQGQPVIQKLLQAFESPIEIEDHRVPMTISIGVALYPDDGRDADVLLRNADIALYRAKEESRNTYRYFTGTESCLSCPPV
ncbi:MAG: diguanylate cyclase [Lamprobacter sp.]|nr:diguanylate cyclase [Lamprobacter sp.]